MNINTTLLLFLAKNVLELYLQSTFTEMQLLILVHNKTTTGDNSKLNSLREGGNLERNKTQKGTPSLSDGTRLCLSQTIFFTNVCYKTVLTTENDL